VVLTCFKVLSQYSLAEAKGNQSIFLLGLFLLGLEQATSRTHVIGVKSLLELIPFQDSSNPTDKPQVLWEVTFHEINII
jgi:hypothetical protein